jgi:hypothetical protein
MVALINILSSNQADIETDTSGFTSFVGGSGSLTRDTSTAVHGLSSLKVVMDGSGGFQNVTAQVLAASWIPNTQYTASWYIKGDGTPSKTLRYFVDSSAGAVSSVQTVTLTSSWQRISVTFTTPNPITATWLGPRLDTGGTEAVTFWIDALQVNPGTLAPWVAGGLAGPQAGYNVYIGGQPVNVIAGTMHAENTIGQRSTGGVRVWSNLGTFWSYGTQVQVYDGIGNLVYAGFTTKDKLTKSGAPQGRGLLEHDITLMDNAYKADKRVIFSSYLATSAGSIVRDIVTRILAAEGVTVTAGSVATGATITEAVWNGKRVSEALDWLATQCGFWWTIDVNSVLWFQPYGGQPAPFTLDGTQVDARTNLSVEYGNDMYVNKQYAKGAVTETGLLTETFHGNSLTRNFTLSYPVSTIKTVTLNGTDVTVHSLAKGNTGGYFYYAAGDAVIAQDTGQTLLTSSDTLVITYKGRYPVLAVAQNQSLIAAQKAREGGTSSGIVESVYSNTKVHTLAAAFQIAGSVLAHYGSDAVVLDFDTRQTGLMEGQMLTVNLPDFGLNNKQMLISVVTISDQNDGYLIWYHVQCVGSPVEAAQWQTYWQGLMNQSSDPSDLADITDTALALLLSTVVVRSPVATVTPHKNVCPIIGNATLCNTTLIIC